MNHETSKQRTFNRKARILAAVLVLAFSAAMPSAWAKSKKPAAQAVQVVDTLSFEGQSAADMVLHENNGKPYLYVRLAGDGGVIIVDVSHPKKLKTVGSLQSANKEPVGGLAIAKDAALVVDATSNNSRTEYNSDQLTLWDISKAGVPRIVQEFHGVKTVIEDERGYIFVLDQHGLSAVSDSAHHPVDEENANVMGYGV